MKQPPDPQQSPGMVLIAPGGYGKTWWLRQWTQPQERVLEAGIEAAFSDEYFRVLQERAARLNLPLPEALPGRDGGRDGGREWAKACAGQPAFWVCLDEWENLEFVERIRGFWQGVVENQPANLFLLLASRKPPDLPLSRFVTRGGELRERADLSWSEAEAQAAWKAVELDWQATDQDFWQASEGWPLGLLLYRQRRQEKISQAAFERLLSEGWHDWLPPFAREAKQLWCPELQSRLKDWQATRHDWPESLRQELSSEARQSPHYWLWQATQFTAQLSRARVCLDRAQSLCRPGQISLKLNILTRLAHNASLSGDWEAHDRALKEAEDWLEDGQSVDQAAWLYLHANRMRQCCRYESAHADLDQLLALDGRHPTVMDFQTRARIMRGLTAYQQGNYTLTREAYQQALYLAESDQNPQMQVELKIMLAFLDALTGTEEYPLPEGIEAQVKALPLSAQPLVWLNLTFYQLLGEHLDLKQGQEILERVRETSNQLEWKALEPMIADVEARLWRFHKDYDRAERLHQQAREKLDPCTFDWLYASLNYALTLLRRQESQAARELLQKVAERAEKTGTLGLWREARAALNALSPESETAAEGPRPKPATPQLVSGNEALLEIQTFGNFQVRLNGKIVDRWPRKRARHLLLHLLMHPHGIHRETLADWLTGSNDLEQALRSLDVHIHSLRKVLEPERKGKQASRYVLFHDACYSFNWNCHYRFDAEDFTQYHQRWLQEREKDPAQAENVVQAALKLYHGNFLPELDFADDWLAEREGYARKAADLVHWSLEHLVEAQHLEQAEERAETLLRWDTLSESGFSWLFRIAGLMRDKSRLQRLGERMEQTYEKEVDSPPPPELMKLYRSISRDLDA